MRKILIVHAGALGDFVLALPAMAALRRAYPQAQIEIIGHPATSELARMAGYVDQITALDRSEWRHLFVDRAIIPEALAASLAACDAIVSWFGFGDETYRAALSASCPRVVIQKAFPPPGSPQHVADYLLETIVPLLPAGFALEDPIPRLSIPETERKAAEKFFLREEINPATESLVAIHPGSGGRRKCWPAARFAELARNLEQLPHTYVLIIEGPADTAILRDFDAHACGIRARRLRHMPLRELAALLSWCRPFIGNDSGITHLAAAIGIPVLALFGPTDPAVWGPRGPNVKILHGPLEQLTMEEVLAAWSQQPKDEG